MLALSLKQKMDIAKKTFWGGLKNTYKNILKYLVKMETKVHTYYIRNASVNSPLAGAGRGGSQGCFCGCEGCAPMLPGAAIASLLPANSAGTSGPRLKWRM